MCTTFPLPTISTPLSRSARQLRAERDVVVERLRRVDRQLHDGDVGVGEHVHQHRPGAVVEPPAVEVAADPRRLDDLGDLLGKLAAAGCGVSHREELVGEAEEVVDGLRALPSR